MIPSVSIPLGLAYIAAMLEQKGHQVKILDALALGMENVARGDGWTRTGLSDREITDVIRSFRPTVVGISSMFTGYASDAHTCARLVKDVNPDIPVVIGGAHASANPNMVLADHNVDIVVKGEGEAIFSELVERLINGGDIFSVPSTVVRKEGEVIFNESGGYIVTLDSIPFPARHLLPMDIYFKYFRLYDEYCMRHPHLGIVTSRGCPARCVFCSIHSVWGHTWRGRSPKNVVDELELLVRDYGIREFSFVDDNFSYDRQRAMAICDEIIARKIDIKWCTPNGVALWALDEVLIRKMKDSGCYRLTFGIESGNSETQRFIGKSIRLDKAKSLISYANSIGLWTISTLIIGFPYEGVDSIKDTIKYAIDCDTDFALFYILGPFPGTPAYEVFKKEGLLDEVNNWGYILGGGGCDTKFFSRQELKHWQARAQAEFTNRRMRDFLNPRRLLSKIHSREDLRYTIGIVTKALKMRWRQTRAKEGDVKLWVHEYMKERKR